MYIAEFKYHQFVFTLIKNTNFKVKRTCMNLLGSIYWTYKASYSNFLLMTAKTSFATYHVMSYILP